MFWNKFYLISYGFILALVLFYITSCSGTKNGNTQRLDIATTNIQNSGTSLDGTTKIIKNEAETILKVTPQNAKPLVDPHAQEIIVQTGKQEEIVKQLKETQKLLEQEKTDKVDLIKQQEELKVKLENEKENATKQLRAKYTTVSIFCFAGMVVCGALFFSGQKWAMGAGLVCAAGLAISIFLVQTVALIPWIVGGILAVIAIVATILFVRKNWKINDLKTIGTELVQSTEALKPFMREAARKDMFGDGPIPGKILTLQSDKTIEFVKEIRDQIPEEKKAPPIERTIASDINGDGVIDERDLIEDTGAPVPLENVEAVKVVKGPKTVKRTYRKIYIVLR